MNIGKQIRFLRTQRKVKQEEVAEYLGVSCQAVSKWETEASTPDIELLPKLATYFGVTIDELFQLPADQQFERIENMFWSERRIKRETFDQAVYFLEEILKDEPDNIRAYLNLAYLYNHRAASDHELASEYAKRVLELDANEKGGWVAYLEANGGVCGDEWYDNHFTLIEYFKDFLQKHPKNFLGLYAIIENLLDDERYEEALPYIEDLQSIRDTHQAPMYLGDVAFGMGEKDRAIEIWEKALAEHRDIWQAHCSMGERYKKIGKVQEAIECFETCFTMQEAPRISDGLYSLAQIHETIGDYAAAIEDRKRLIRCVKEEYHVTSGEAIDQHKREIERLQELAKKQK